MAATAWRDTPTLARAYRATGDRRALAAIVEANLGLVRREAQRFMRPWLDFDELVNVGVLGLLSAAPRFNPELGSFAAYAGLSVRRYMHAHVRRAASVVWRPEYIGGWPTADSSLDAPVDESDEEGMTRLELLAGAGATPADLVCAVQSCTVSSGTLVKRRPRP